MRRLPSVAIMFAILCGAAPVGAQQLGRFSGEVGLGVAHRSLPALGASSTDGFQLLARGGWRLRQDLHLVAELSLITFPDEAFVVPVLCPVGAPCLAAKGIAAGLGMAGLAAGLQPRVRAGPIEFRLTASAGTYWLYHHASGVPSLAPGVRGTLGLGLPVGSRMHVILEASSLSLFAPTVHDANTRNIGIGLAVN